MPPKSSRRKGKNKGNASSLSTSVFSAGATVTCRQPSFKLQQGTSGTGAITSNLTGVSLTNASNIRLTPFSIGSRVGLFGNLYLQWRVKRLIIQYIPDETSSGVLDQVAGAGTTPSYGNRAFALGWNKDPDITFSTADGIIEAGGQDGNTSRRVTIKCPSSPWLWTSTTSASPTAIDQRMCAHGQLSCIFRNTSTTTATTYGRLDLSLEAEFRYPVVSSVVGDTEDESKVSDSPLMVSVKEETETKVAPASFAAPSTPGPVKEGLVNVMQRTGTAPAIRIVGRGTPLQGQTGWFS